MKPRLYSILIVLLLLQLFIRSHHIMALPLFVDEGNHIKRAAAFHDLTMHPAQESQGKLLLYVLLGIGDLSDYSTAIHLSRTLVALASLLTSALIFRVVKRWSNAEYGLLAVAIYALLPYAFFYERMALADPWAGTWGIASLWASIRLGEKPTWNRAAWVGISTALAVMAKLTLSLVVIFPVLAFLILVADQKRYGRNMLHPYELAKAALPYLIAAGIVFIILWLPVLIPARISYMNDTAEDDFIIANSEWVAGEQGTPLLTKFEQTWTKYSQLASLPFAIISVGILIGGVYYQPRRMGYLLACLALAWLPSIFLVLNLQTRYLMSGLPIGVAAIAIAFASLPTKGRSMIRFGAICLMAWSGLFALPFAYHLLTDPPSVTMPPLDERNYFWDKYNAYGNREALDYLDSHVSSNSVIQVFPLTHICLHLDLEAPPTMQITCVRDYVLPTVAETGWQAAVTPFLQQGEAVYILTSLQPDVPPKVEGIQWEQLAAFPKPFGHQTVTLWRVSETQ